MSEIDEIMDFDSVANETDNNFIWSKIGQFDKWDSNRFGEHIVETHKEANENGTVFGSRLN